MNNTLITNWNNRVKKKDIVYHLGDVGFGNIHKIISILELLNGKIYIIPGNHDKWIKNFIYSEKIKILPPIVNLKYDKKLFLVLCHYPMRSWEMMKYGAIHLHGHVHINNYFTELPNSIDVGVDNNNYIPVSLDEIIGKIREF